MLTIKTSPIPLGLRKKKKKLTDHREPSVRAGQQRALKLALRADGARERRRRVRRAHEVDRLHPRTQLLRVAAHTVHTTP